MNTGKSLGAQSAPIIMFACATFCVVVATIVQAVPATNINLYSPTHKLDNKEDKAAESFRQFIRSKPGSTVIGEFKPNASELEMMLLRNKIANTIASMQEMEKVGTPSPLIEETAECYIDLTRVEKVPGKCRKVSTGMPICQADNYIAISNDCN